MLFNHKTMFANYLEVQSNTLKEYPYSKGFIQFSSKSSTIKTQLSIKLIDQSSYNHSFLINKSPLKLSCFLDLKLKKILIEICHFCFSNLFFIKK